MADREIDPPVGPRPLLPSGYVNGYAHLCDDKAPFELSASMSGLPLLPRTVMDRLVHAVRRATGKRSGHGDSWTYQSWGHGQFDDVFLLRSSEDHQEFVFRMASPSQLALCGRKWVHDKMLSEAHALRLLASHGLPVPTIVVACCDLNLLMDCCKPGGSETLQVIGIDLHGIPCRIESRLDGSADEWASADLSDEAKSRMARGCAALAVQVSRIPAPQDQGIGSLGSFDPSTGAVTLGPFRDLPRLAPAPGGAHRQLLLGTAGSPFESDLCFLRYYADFARLDALHHSALFGIEGLLRFLRPPSSDATCHRLVFHRFEGSTPGIFTEQGHLKGVAGFDFFAVVPLFFAAREPAFLLSDDHHLERVFDEAARELDPDYCHALTWGRPLRQLVDWLRGWSDEPSYAEAFREWRQHVEAFDTLDALIAHNLAQESISNSTNR